MNVVSRGEEWRTLNSRRSKSPSDLILLLRSKRIPLPEVLSHSLALFRGELLPLLMAFPKKLLILRRKLFPPVHPAAHFPALLRG
jgi:hypothetical protein